MTTFVASSAGRAAPPLSAGPDNRTSTGDWVGGTVTAVEGFINPAYTVTLDNGRTVSATDTGDGGLAEGSRVWVVIADGGDALIVGRQ